MSVPNQKGVESRRSPRRVFRRSIGLLCGGVYVVMQAQQIGEGGLLFSADVDLQKGDLTVVTLLLPEGGYAIVRARIVYEMQPDQRRPVRSFGIEFIDLPLPKRRLIRNYVAAKTEIEIEEEMGFNA